MAPLDTNDNLQTDTYDFDLPRELIAQHPVPNRVDSRLMAISRDSGAIEHLHFRDLPGRLRPHDCLVINNTKVVPAKLVGVRTSTGGRWHGLFLEADQLGNWKLLCKTRGRLKLGETVTLEDRNGAPRIQMTMLARLDDGGWLARPESPAGVDELLGQLGRVPLPHYIRGGNMVDADLNDYQTVYARQPGAVAAPTAGLHFTEALFRRLIDNGVRIAQVTLHVGIGTFRPVSSANLDQHHMHAERGQLDQENLEIIQRCQAAGGRLIAVGTTSVRVLETAARSGRLEAWSGDTDLFIKPGFAFKAIDGLLTNFHLPRSSLIVLVRTFGGDQLIRKAYDVAIEEKYRFFSYGDAMLII